MLILHNKVQNLLRKYLGYTQFDIDFLIESYISSVFDTISAETMYFLENEAVSDFESSIIPMIEAQKKSGKKNTKEIEDIYNAFYGKIQQYPKLQETIKEKVNDINVDLSISIAQSLPDEGKIELAEIMVADLENIEVQEKKIAEYLKNQPK